MKTITCPHCNKEFPEAPPKAKRPSKPREHREYLPMKPLDLRSMHVEIVGDSALVCHPWTERYLGRGCCQGGTIAPRPKRVKPPKPVDPGIEMRKHLYIISKNGEPLVCGFPSAVVKDAAVAACAYVAGVTKLTARSCFGILPDDLIVINGTPTLREDKLQSSFASLKFEDVRYRAEFKTWSSTFMVRFNANQLSAERIIDIFDTAGFAIGIGEWRPYMGGHNGTFHARMVESPVT